MGEVLYRGNIPHHCTPFMDEKWIKSPMPNRSTEPIEIVPPLGTIWRCDCGRLWEVVKQPYVNVFPDRKWARAGLWTSLKWRRR